MQAIRDIIARVRRKLFGGPPVPPHPVREPEGPPWCVVGNIVESHLHGEQKVRLSGTKHFSARTKVYCLPDSWHADGRLTVIGRCRKSKRWITVVMKSNRIENWRAKAVYEPAVLRRLERARSHYISRPTEDQARARAEHLRNHPPTADSH